MQPLSFFPAGSSETAWYPDAAIASPSGNLRIKALSRIEAASALQVFHAERENLIRLQLIEVMLARAVPLAREHGLHGYDAVHLAAALFWQGLLRRTDYPCRVRLTTMG